jgi:hypothetical protein
MVSRLLEASPLLRAATDVISLLAPQTEAGACIPEMGELCWCNCYFLGCDPYGCYYNCYKVKLNCYGSCVEYHQYC